MLCKHIKILKEKLLIRCYFFGPIDSGSKMQAQKARQKEAELKTA